MQTTSKDEGENDMMSPREKYCNDVAYKQLVDMMVEQIIACKYSPSEMREAALLASIRYEQMTVRDTIYPKEVLKWLNTQS